MNRPEMADKLKRTLGLESAAAAERILLALFDPERGIIADELSAGGEVTISGFGTFLTRLHGPRTGRNPQTGAPIAIAARRSPAVRFGQGMRRRVQG